MVHNAHFVCLIVEASALIWTEVFQKNHPFFFCYYITFNYLCQLSAGQVSSSEGYSCIVQENVVKFFQENARKRISQLF